MCVPVTVRKYKLERLGRMSSTYEKFAWGALSGVCGGLAVYASMRMRTLQTHLQPAARQAITTASVPPPPPASSTLPTAAAPAALRLSQDAQHAASVLRKVAPRMNGASHKGQGGRVGILGGSMEYTGAPYYAGTANPMLHLRARTHPTFTLYPSERERISSTPWQKKIQAGDTTTRVHFALEQFR